MDEFTFQTALARKIDISCVQAFHTYAEIDRMIEAAIKYHFAAAFTLPAFSSYVAKSCVHFQKSTLAVSSASHLAEIPPSRKCARRQNCWKPDARNWTW